MAENLTIRCYQRDVKKSKPLTVEEELALCERIKKGDKAAQNRLIEGSLRTVWKIAKRYAVNGIDIFDLIQEGNLGLIHAAQIFDSSNHVRFNTYAIYWIRMKIMRYYNEKIRLVRLPVYQEVLYYKIKNYCEIYCKENGKNPTLQQISERVNKPVSTVKRLMLDAELYTVFDLDSGSQEDNGHSCQDTYKDMRDNPEEKCCNNMEKEALYKALSTLSDREQQMLKMKFGFSGKEYTLAEISKHFDMTIEGCRQVQLKAIKKLQKYYKI